MRYFLGSADMMSRKLDRRVEVVTPVAEPAVQARLQEPTTTDVDIHRRPQALARGGPGRANGRSPHSSAGPEQRRRDLARGEVVRRVRGRWQSKAGALS